MTTSPPHPSEQPRVIVRGLRPTAAAAGPTGEATPESPAHNEPSVQEWPATAVPDVASPGGRQAPVEGTANPDTDAHRPLAASGRPATTEPKPAVTLRFSLGELSATPDAMAVAHRGGVQIVALVLRHLGCDWGDVDPVIAAGNNQAVTGGGPLRSAYRIPDGDDVIVISTGIDRRSTVATVDSPPRPIDHQG